MARCFEIIDDEKSLKVSAEIDGKKFFIFVDETEEYKGVRVYEEKILSEKMVYDSNKGKYNA